MVKLIGLNQGQETQYIVCQFVMKKLYVVGQLQETDYVAGRGQGGSKIRGGQCCV